MLLLLFAIVVIGCFHVLNFLYLVRLLVVVVVIDIFVLDIIGLFIAIVVVVAIGGVVGVDYYLGIYFD